MNILDQKLTTEDINDLRWMDTFNFFCQEEKDWLRGRAERQRSLAEWKAELGEYPMECRKRYLRQEIARLVEWLNKRADEYAEITREDDQKKTWVLPLLAKNAYGIAETLKRYRQELAALKSPKAGEITDAMVEVARNHPIEKIVPVRNGRTRCVFHQGEHLNMDVRKNFAYCYVCGESGDAISVYMKANDVGFIQAVKALV